MVTGAALHWVRETDPRGQQPRATKSCLPDTAACWGRQVPAGSCKAQEFGQTFNPEAVKRGSPRVQMWAETSPS